jgi:hypothetical protein
LLLDVGPSMHAVLPEVKKICSTLVHKKASTCTSIHIVQSLYYFITRTRQTNTLCTSVTCSLFILGAMRLALSRLEPKVSYLQSCNDFLLYFTNLRLVLLTKFMDCLGAADVQKHAMNLRRSLGAIST